MHGPAEMHFEIVGGLHHIGRLQQPFAAARGNEKSEDRRIDADHQRIGVLRGYAYERMADLVG